MSCPKCGKRLDMDPDGGWCDSCEDYFPMDILIERMEEEE